MKHLYLKSVCLILFMILPLLGFTQKKIKLTNTKSKKEVFLTEGKRVVYVLKDKPGSKTGILNKITADSIVVDERLLGLEELKSIGKKSKGSGFLTFLMAGFGGAMIGAALAPEPDPCQNCQTVSVEDNGGSAFKAIYAIVGLAVVIIAINSATKNSPRNISNEKWSLEVVE